MRTQSTTTKRCTCASVKEIYAMQQLQRCQYAYGKCYCLADLLCGPGCRIFKAYLFSHFVTIS